MVLRFATRLFVAACFVLIDAVLSPAPAQTGDGTIQAIAVEGNRRIEASTIRNYLDVDVGDPFDPSRLDASLRTLFGTGLFEDVSLDREGDTLVVRVEENAIINQIAFEGNDKLGDDVLETEIQLRPRQVYRPADVQNAVERIVELYRRNGRFAAAVEPKIIEQPQNRVDLVFEISEGPLTGVERINFIGNEAYSDSTLRGVIETSESAFWKILSTTDNYDPDRLNFDQELLRRFYLERGYAEFQVTSAIAELTPDGEGFFITITVDEGQIYNFGAIDVASQVPDVDPETLRNLLEVSEGKTFNAERVQESVLAITEELGRRGYAFTQVEPVSDIDPQNQTIDVTFNVQEGPQVYVERIDIIGNLRTLDRVIRREFRLSEGDAFNTDLLRESERRVRNLGFFESVDVRTEQGSAPDRIAITVEVVERSTGELSFGAGFSTSDGVLGDVRLSERNLLGRGQDLSIRATLSGRRQEIDLSFTEPYFLGYDLAAGFDLFSTRTDFQDESSFDQESLGGVLRAAYPLSRYWRNGWRYTLRTDEISNVPDDASQFIRQEEGDTLTSAVGTSFTYDRRDNRFLPSEGLFFDVDFDVAGLGGDKQYLRTELDTRYYFPFTPDIVLNLNANAGAITGYAGDDVRLSDRFFIGGNSFRGFRFAGIGPRDITTNDALGGNLYGVGTVELRFPLGLPEELRIFGRGFVDAGTLTEIDIDSPLIADSGAIRAAGGVGVSWLSPLGPISIDYAEPIKKEDEDRTENFRVSFGTRF